MNRPPIPEPILKTRVIAIARGLDPQRILPVAGALQRGGVRAIEVTLDSPGALESIAALADQFAEEEMLVGAGTVLDVPSAETAMAAGARYLVMPHTDAGLVAHATERSMPVFPGATTPTEVLAAWSAGASAVKLFPAGSLGPGYVREVLSPLRGIPLVPTGGIHDGNVREYLDGGSTAVGVGGWLISGGDAAGVQVRTEFLMRAIAAAATLGV